MRIDIEGEITMNELNELRVLLDNENVTVDRGLSKGIDLHHVLNIVFSDFNYGNFLRDKLVDTSIMIIINKIRLYYKHRKDLDLKMQFDDSISFMEKTFNLKINCSIEQFPNIRTLLNLKLTPHIQGLVPQNSTLFVEGQDDDTIKVTIVERGTGRQYTI